MAAPYELYTVSEMIQGWPDRNSRAPGEVCYDELHERFLLAVSQGRGRFDWVHAHPPNPRFEMYMRTDCWEYVGGPAGWSEFNGAGGNTSQDGPAAGEDVIGASKSSIPAVVSAYANLTAGSKGWRPGLGEIRQTWRCKVDAPSDGVNPYFLRFGLIPATSDIVKKAYGIWFEHDQVSANWFCETRTAGVSERTDSLIAVASNVYHTFDYVLNAATTQVRFYIDEALVATNTLNIPPNATGVFGPCTQFYRDPAVAGALTRTTHWDFHEIGCDIDGGRVP